MNSEVPIQQLLPDKAMATELTVERFLVSMCSHSMHRQLVNRGKSLETCLNKIFNLFSSMKDPPDTELGPILREPLFHGELCLRVV